jgi:6-phosphogluconate dehydrogenase
MIGLGRMGANMTERLLRGGHECVVHDRSEAAVRDLARKGATGAATIAELVDRLSPPRVVWMMVPVAAVADVIASLRPHVAAGDILLDGGNSHYRDASDRARDLSRDGVHYVDVGVSGGIFGLEHGYCLMIGGDRNIASALAPLFATLAPGNGTREPRGDPLTQPQDGFLYCGPSGAGHFVKMVHNGIEYGMMAAYAEGFNLLRHADAGDASHAIDAETTPLRDPLALQYDLDTAGIAELWRHGSVIRSWLLDLTAQALADDPALAGLRGEVADSGEGRWTVQAAIDAAVPVPVLSAALFARFSSRNRDDFAHRILSAMRREFGGHKER